MSDFHPGPAPKQTAQNFTVDPATLPPLPAEFFEAMNEPAPKQTAENFTVDPATLAPLPFLDLY